MIKFCKLVCYRSVAAFLVFTGKAMPVYISKSDTTVLVVETDGSQPEFISCRNLVEDTTSYNILLSKIFLWVTTKNRYFWTADNLGSQVKALAEESFEAHKKEEESVIS